jgi:hypothetical protein
MMRSKLSKLVPVCVAMLALLVACNYPGLGAPTPFPFATPNLTLTAIFDINPNEFPTQSPGQTAPTATQQEALPTATHSPPTATTMPTSTPEPTVSYVGPDERSGFSVTAHYLDERPTIDGSLEDWDLDRYRIESVVYGTSNYDGQDDLAARLMVGWDDDNLYLGARVLDDVYVQNARGEDLFKGDSLEILLDTEVSQDFYLRELSADDYQLGLSPGNPQPGEDPEAYLWFPSALEGERDRVRIGVVGIDEGYRIEAQIPWSIFDVEPARGQHFGFAFSVSDNDKLGDSVQQSMISSVNTRTLTDPTTWGDLTLAR